MSRRALLILGGGSLLALVAVISTSRGRNVIGSLFTRLRGRATVEERLAQYGASVEGRLRPFFERAGVAYPPAFVVLAGYKKERKLEVYAGPSSEDLRFLRSYDILGASGSLGPKLREGDRQVPEGFYAIESLNPNSRFHLALRLGYPNEFDRQMAEVDSRENPGGDIMIHGGTASIGCLAMGDPEAEDLFVLAARAGVDRVQVILSPVDFRISGMPSVEGLPAWVQELHGRLKQAIKALPQR